MENILQTQFVMESPTFSLCLPLGLSPSLHPSLVALSVSLPFSIRLCLPLLSLTVPVSLSRSPSVSVSLPLCHPLCLPLGCSLSICLSFSLCVGYPAYYIWLFSPPKANQCIPEQTWWKNPSATLILSHLSVRQMISTGPVKRWQLHITIFLDSISTAQKEINSFWLLATERHSRCQVKHIWRISRNIWRVGHFNNHFLNTISSPKCGWQIVK